MSALGEFVLMACIKGELPVEEDDYYLFHLVLHLRAQHALGSAGERREAEEALENCHAAPNDDLIYELLTRWRQQLNGARTISSRGRGRRSDDEMEWIKYHLYLVTAEEHPATVRSIYYRAVTRGIVPKTEAGYRLVQNALLNMRRGGLLPWYWITDTSRRVWGHRRFGDMASYAEHVAKNYRMDYWANSPRNVEVWCEKDAMQGVIAPVVIEEFGLNLYVSKGQASASYLYEAAEEIRSDGRPTTIYVLSDFDPAGFRIAERIETGLREHLGNAVVLSAHRVAVTYEQVVENELPTRPVKRSDTGAPDFLVRYGDVSAELEAMPPNMLRAMIREHLEGHMDQGQLETLKMVEAEERVGLERLQDLLGGAA